MSEILTVDDIDLLQAAMECLYMESTSEPLGYDAVCEKLAAMRCAAPDVQGESASGVVPSRDDLIQCLLATRGQSEGATADAILSVLTADPQPAERRPELCRSQPCGCVVCICEHETKCMGCGAKHCGTHPVGHIPVPAYQQPDVARLVKALEQVIKSAPSGGPLWHGSEQIVEARNALAAHRKQRGEP